VNDNVKIKELKLVHFMKYLLGYYSLPQSKNKLAIRINYNSTYPILLKLRVKLFLASFYEVLENFSLQLLYFILHNFEIY